MGDAAAGMLAPAMSVRILRAQSAQYMNAPIRVAITGAAGQIGYSLLFRIASGAMFGPAQPAAEPKQGILD